MPISSWKFLSALFVIFVYGCVFLEIESWPFSDFRVYQHRFHPSRVRSLRLSIEENGQEKWLYQGKDAHRNNPINHIFSMNPQTIRFEDFRSLAEYQLGYKCHASNPQIVRLKQIHVLCEDQVCNSPRFQQNILYEMEIPVCS